jgi:hypothetical protein
VQWEDLPSGSNRWEILLKNRLFVLIATCVAAVAAGTAAPTAPATPAIAAKTCSAGFTHAVIGGVQKCLRRGEFCAHRYDRQYRRYGFRCIRYYANVGRYRLT